MTSSPDRLVDSFGRVHNNLRISVTDRCNIRCSYCMPENVQFLDRRDLLTFEEIERFSRVAASLGIDKIRLTGGEPLVRRDLDRLIAMLAAIPGIKDLGLTTNGLLLAAQADRLRDAGLKRINISLDTMDAGKFRQLTRRDGWEQVIEGILAAKAAGFERIKINAIALKGSTEDDIVPLARFAREQALELRFIEYMPLDAADVWDRGKVLLAEEILERVAQGVGPLAPARDQDPRSPSVDHDYLDGLGRVGVIASVSRPFCGSCNRIRITADGKLRNCLFALDETDLRPLLRAENLDDRAIARALMASVAGKWEGHEINSATFIKPDRLMHAIGG
jgi:cyclic pyranopterin phosphate synthase